MRLLELERKKPSVRRPLTAGDENIPELKPNMARGSEQSMANMLCTWETAANFCAENTETWGEERPSRGEKTEVSQETEEKAYDVRTVSGGLHLQNIVLHVRCAD